MTDIELDRIFTYAVLEDEQRAICRSIFAATRQLAKLINKACPESREKSLAITALQTALLWCDAAIAIHGRDAAKSG